MPSAAEFRAAKLVQTRAEAKFIWIMPSAAEVRKIFFCKARANESRDKFYLAMPSAAEFRKIFLQR